MHFRHVKRLAMGKLLGFKGFGREIYFELDLHLTILDNGADGYRGWGAGDRKQPCLCQVNDLFG